MARLSTTGFELNDLSIATSSGNSIDGLITVNASGVSTQSSVVRSGSFAAQFNSGAGNSSPAINPGPDLGILFSTETAYVRMYFRVNALPTSNTDILGLGLYGSVAVILSGRLTTTGTLQFWNENSNVQIGSDSTQAITAGNWYRLEMSCTFNSSSVITGGELRLDGVTVASTSSLSLSGSAGNWQVGWVGSSPGINTSIYVDDVAINDNTGTVNNSWPGPGNVVLLKPVSDNARGTNWVAGAGGTTNLWQGVDNTPPVGVVIASATNTSQVKNVTKDTTGNYDANVTSYTSAGVPAGATINVVQGIWNVSGTTSVALQVVSNPAIASETDVSPNLTSGTYPSSWKWQGPAGQRVEAPTPTFGTSPVVRVGKRTSSTSPAQADFMGIYVDFTPAVPSLPPSLVLGQAVKRASYY